MTKNSLLLTLSFAAIVLVSTITLAWRTESSGGWWQVIVGVLTIATIALVSNTLASLWARKPQARAAKLAQRPGAIVIQSARIGGLQAFLSAEGAIDPVLYITAVVEPGGISFWRDYSPTKVWRSLDAAKVIGVEVEPFVESGRSRYRLRIATHDGFLLLPVLGEGLIGMMSPTLTEVESVAEVTRATLKVN